MSSRLRSLDSKISFFAFADIITAVSGVLIFVALLLATDLGRPAGKPAQPANAEAEQELQETLAQQQEAAAANHRLEELLAEAEASPDADKLRADIARLQTQLTAAQKKQAAVAGEMAGSETKIAARDQALGLTDIKAAVQKIIREAEEIEDQARQAKESTDGLEQRVARTETKLLKLRERDGQIWLIPERNMTTKEPVLVTVSGAGETIERFDNPAARQQVATPMANIKLNSFLETNKATDVYVVFLIRPSGIELFHELVTTARNRGFEVGYDALEEDKQVHFSEPPPIEEPVTPPTPVTSRTATTTVSGIPGMPGGSTVPGGTPGMAGGSTIPPGGSAGMAGAKNEPGASGTSETPPASAGKPAANVKPVPPPPPPSPTPPPPAKSWWERLLEWIGLR